MREIEAIEMFDGWSPRVLVHNKTHVKVHLRLSCPGIQDTVAIYENDVEAGKLRVIPYTPGLYELEVILSVPGNKFMRPRHVVKAIDNLDYQELACASSL